jgi:2-keto-4-pentenoate hydratase/2-oxohepta-3-ene-1,7-dioic acid hydratase in catechol pathway
MRLFGYLDDGRPAIGVETNVGRGVPVGPLEQFYADVDTGLSTARSALRRASIDPSPNTFERDESTQIPAVPNSAKVVCVGLNYASHAAETGQEVPAAPAVFARWAGTLDVDGGSVSVPRSEPGLDWEAELAVVISTPAYQISPAEAAETVLGYSAFNDLTARDRQFASSQWTLGKNVPGSGPLGPVVVTRDEIPEPVDLHLESRVNGAVMQQARTSELIFSVPELISFVSQTVALQPGDVLATGTPAGIGYARDPRVLLGPGDQVVVEIESIGVLRTEIVSALGHDEAETERASTSGIGGRA